MLPRLSDRLAHMILGSWEPGELEAGIGGLGASIVVAYLLYRLVRRVPSPRRFRLWFVLLHVAAAIVFMLAWMGLSILFESMLIGSFQESRNAWPVHLRERPLPILILYGIVTWIAYSAENRARIARTEAQAAQTQLAALRAQLHPHFLFNALHTVVQLIPIDPVRAGEAAELVASLLRTTIEENRDEIPLDDEWTFVSRYLEVERIRFGDRLRVQADVDEDLLDEYVPSFSLQTLVENAVRHGAARRVAATDIIVRAQGTDANLTLSVRNTGDRLPEGALTNGKATGLSRLQERLGLMYGGAARLTYGPRQDGDFEAVLVVPRGKRDA